MTTIKELIEWCDRKSKIANPLIVSWSGGGDEGEIEINIPHDEVQEPEAKFLIDLVEKYTIFGFFAFVGNQSVYGSATYDRDNKKIVVEDFLDCDDVENENLTNSNKQVSFSLPSKYKCDTFEIYVDSNTNIRFSLGDEEIIDDPELTKILDPILVSLEKLAEELYDDAPIPDTYEFLWDDGVDDGKGNRIFSITEVRTREKDSGNKVIDLLELLKTNTK